MGSINWVGRSAVGVLSLAFSGGTALAQENAGAMDRVPIDTGAREPFRYGVRAMPSRGGQLRRKIRSSVLDWGTGGFELRGERLRSGIRLIDSVRLGFPWQRTYAADVRFWQSATPEITVEAGARVARTRRGVAPGPLLTSRTKTLARMAYVGVQISDAASIRLIRFDNGGGTDDATGQNIGRIPNGEPAARKGAAIEIGRSGLQAGNARWSPQFTLRVERGRTAARSATSATLSWKVRL